MSEQQGLEKIVRRRQVFTVGGRRFELAALTVRDYVEARQQALDAYRREQAHAWEVASEILSDEDRRACIVDAVKWAANIAVDQLPEKTVKIPKRGPDGQPVMGEDGEAILDERAVEYGIWWASETIEGKVFCTWLSMRACQGQEDMTLDDVAVLFTDSLEELAQAADTVVDLSTPTQVPDPNRESRRATVVEARRRKREERRRRGKG